jgi:hypothetical protein
VRVVQALLDTAACLLVVPIGRRFGGRFAGLCRGFSRS